MTAYRYGDGLMRDFPQEIRDALADLKGARASYHTRRQQLRFNAELYGPDRDRQLWQLDREIATQAPGRIREKTAQCRRLREYAIESINAELSRQKPRSWDYQALTFRAAEYKQMIESTPAMGDAFGSESRVVLIQRLRNQLIETRDEAGLKALRQAALPHLSRPALTMENPQWHEALDLARQFRADAAAEEGEVVRALRVEREAVASMLDMIEHEAREAENEYPPFGGRLGFERREQLTLDPGLAFGENTAE